MTDNLDELKRQWQRLSTRCDNLEEANRALSERLAKSKVTSMQEQLANRINSYAGVGFLLPAMSPLLHSTMHLPWWVCVCYALFGLIMAFLSFRFARFIRSKRLIDLPVSDAIRRAMDIKVRQNRIQFIGAIMAVFLLGSMLWCMPEPYNEWVIYGFLTGAVIGLSIGIPRAVKNHRLARRLIDSLKE